MPRKTEVPKIFEAEIGLKLKERIILVKRTSKGVPIFILDDKTSQEEHVEIIIDTEKKFKKCAYKKMSPVEIFFCIKKTFVYFIYPSIYQRMYLWYPYKYQKIYCVSKLLILTIHLNTWMDGGIYNYK